MNVSNYWLLQLCGEDDSAILSFSRENDLESWELHQGELLKDTMNAPIMLKFGEDFPDNVKLYDFVNNSFNLLVVSSAVKKIFDQFNVTKLEYLPTRIYDHRNVLVSEDYFLINMLDHQPIIDMEKSQYTMSNINKDVIQFLSKLHLNLAEVEEAAKLFGMKRKKGVYVITEDVIEALRAAGISGLSVILAEGWNGMTLKF